MSRSFSLPATLHDSVRLASTSVELIATGAAAVDARLGGGIVRAALHEVYAAHADDSSAAAGFALLLALRVCPEKPILWVREDRGEIFGGRLHAPGLVELGADPNRVLIVTAPDALAVLRAGADIIACPGVGTVLLEPWGRAAAADLTASRRLALAAGRSGVTAFMLRIEAEPSPSAAQTRWSVAAAPSQALEANAPGQPRFAVSLQRHRGGVAPFDAIMEWDRDRGAFTDAPLSGGVSALAAGRAAGPLARRAA